MANSHSQRTDVLISKQFIEKKAAIRRTSNSKWKLLRSLGTVVMKTYHTAIVKYDYIPMKSDDTTKVCGWNN